MKVILVTGRTIDQGVGKERGKGSKEYFESASVCFLDEEDMKKLGIKTGVNVQVSTQFGSVILKALKYQRGRNPGLIFVPCGLWANAVCGDETSSIGMPYFKNIPAEIEPAPNEPILKLEELMLKEFGR